MTMVTIHPVDGYSLPTDPSTCVELPSLAAALSYAEKAGHPFWCYYGHGLGIHKRRDPYPDFIIEPSKNGKMRKVLA